MRLTLVGLIIAVLLSWCLLFKRRRECAWSLALGLPKFMRCPRCGHVVKLGLIEDELSLGQATVEFTSEGFQCGWCDLRFFSPQQAKAYQATKQAIAEQAARG